jgi:hypothetical protein
VPNLNFTEDSLIDFIKFISMNFQTSVIHPGMSDTGVFLRHDIDLDVASAERVGKLEADFGIASSFFFRITGDSYNIFSLRNSKIVKGLSSLGHEIGLHFDPKVYGNQEIPLESCFINEVNQLSTLLGKPIQAYSMHNPSSTGVLDVESALMNCYDVNYFPREGYLSDSRMRFLQNPYAFLESRKNRVAQILLHPIHFTGDGTYSDILSKMMLNKVQNLQNEMNENSTFYDAKIDLAHELHRITGTQS